MKSFPATLHSLLAAFAIVVTAQAVAQSVRVSPSTDRTPKQPLETTVSTTAVSGQLTVSAASGADISGAVNTALSTAKSTCGSVTVAPGSYTWKTAEVQMLPCETLTGTGATILVNVGSAVPKPFLIVEGPNPPNPDPNKSLTVGNIRGFTFVGPSAPTSQSSSTGIGLGGSTPAETAQLINLYDVHVRGFGCGVQIAYAFQISYFGGSIEANYDGVCFPDLITGLENLNFHGTQILNNIDYGIDENQTGLYTELNLIACSLDYNGQYRTTGGEVQMTNGKLTVLGGHFENNTLPMITIAVPGAPATVSVFISGAGFDLTDTISSHNYSGFLSVLGLNDVVEIGRGVSFISQGATVSAVAKWKPIVNQNSRLFMDPYTYEVREVGQGLAAYVGTAPNNYSFPVYDTHDNVLNMMSSY